jgi:type III secretion system chaperone SycN
MTWVSEAMEEFGRQMGLESLAWDEHRQVHFELDGGGMMGIEADGTTNPPDYLVYHSAPLGYDASNRRARALSVTDYRRGMPWTIQAGEHDGMLLLAARIPERMLSLGILDQAFAALARLHSEIAAR